MEEKVQLAWKNYINGKCKIGNDVADGEFRELGRNARGAQLIYTRYMRRSCWWWWVVVSANGVYGGEKTDTKSNSADDGVKGGGGRK